MKQYQIRLGWVILAALVSGGAVAWAQVTVSSVQSGNWTDSTTWGGASPTDNDVVICGGHTITNSGTSAISINSLTITGTLTHAVGTANAINFDIANDVTITAAGSINVDGKGYETLGHPSQSRAGAGHGGEGGVCLGVRGAIYGSITNPVLQGSYSGKGNGGGLVILQVGGDFDNSGTITAKGLPEVHSGTGGGAGSGGSINLTVDGAITSSGMICADGGNGDSETGYDQGGGGGRIAIRLTGAGDFTGVDCSKITAYGGTDGAGRGGGGTVYLKTAAQTYGDLIVDNRDQITTSLTSLKDHTYRFDSISLSNEAVVVVGTNGVLDLTGCALYADSTTNAIGARLLRETGDGPILWPATYTNTGTISWSGTNGMAVATDLTVGPGGIFTHEVGSTHSLFLTVTGNLTVASGGAIWVRGRGYSKATGPTGYGGDGRVGGSHGGQGGYGHGTTTLSVPYDSVTNPLMPGGGGDAGAGSPYGGGLVILRVTGSATVNGTIDANAAENNGGAGGTVNIQGANLLGNGTVSVDGGTTTSSDSGGGGGGRIAVVLTNSTTFGNVVMSATGGYGNPSTTVNRRGGAGTIYLRDKDQTYGRLIVPASIGGSGTLISTLMTDTDVGDVELRSDALLSIDSNRTLCIYGNWSNATDLAIGGDGFVALKGGTTNTLFGSSTFPNLVCTNAGKALLFEAGSTNTVTTSLRLTGASGNLVSLLPATPSQTWFIKAADGCQLYDIKYLAISNSIVVTNGGQSITAQYSDDLGGNTDWIFSNPAPIQWTGGAGSTTWTAPANWDLGRAPLADDLSITIAPAAHQPVLDIDRSYNGALIVQSGATLSLNDNDLTMGGAVTNAGALTATGTETLTCQSNVVFTGTFTPAQGTVCLDGSGLQTFAPGDNSFYALDIANTNTVTVSDGFTARDLTFSSSSAAVTFGAGFTATNVSLVVSNGASLTFASGQTYTVPNRFLLRGASGAPIVLTGAGEWDLVVDGYAAVLYANVANSDASSGRDIFAVQSTDSGGNTDWNFDAGKAWAGTDSDWNTAGNWSPSGVPALGSYVLIEGSASETPRLTNATTISGLTLAALSGPAVLAVDMPFSGGVLTVNGDVDIGTDATLTHTAGNEVYRLALDVGGNLSLAAGGTIDVSSKGYAVETGAGAGSGRAGAGHGGEGGDGYTGDPGTTYGSIIDPERCGSGGGGTYGGRGGGVVLLSVTGTADIEGPISADGGDSGNVSGGGAGGSINIEVDSIAGAGTITANGGDGVNVAGGGGGGRIAVRLTSGSKAQFDTLTFEAGGGALGSSSFGTRENGAGGTVYLRGSDQVYGQVTIANPDYTTPAVTDIPAAIDPVIDELRDLEIVVTNQGSIMVTTNASAQSLTVAGLTESLDLGAVDTRLTLGCMTVNGTTYTRVGLYTVADWQGNTTPTNVTGNGEIIISASGTLFLVR